jgi:hypothetical protein
VSPRPREAARRAVAPELSRVRAAVAAGLLVAALGAPPPSRAPSLGLVLGADGGCAVAPLCSARPCECSQLPARLRRVLQLPLPLNHADEEDLALLPGVGPRRAEAIVRERAARGGFSAPGDLARVAGIGALGASRLALLVFVERDPCDRDRQAMCTGFPSGWREIPILR